MNWAVLLSGVRAILSGCPGRAPFGRRGRAAAGILPDDLYIPLKPWQRIGRPVKHDPAIGIVTDDWPKGVYAARIKVEQLKRWLR